MSKRTANCDHANWDIGSGSIVRCRACGETIDQNELDDWLHHDEPVAIELLKETIVKPLTFRLGDAQFA